MVLLRQIREKKGMSQKQLSAISKIPQQTISSIENETRKNPGIETLLPIANALGCTLDELVGKSKKKERREGQERDAG